MNIGDVVSLLVFVLMAVGISNVVYRLTRWIPGTILISATATVILHQAIGILVVGYLDTFFLIAVTVTWPIALVLSTMTVLISKRLSAKQQ